MVVICIQLSPLSKTSFGGIFCIPNLYCDLDKLPLAAIAAKAYTPYNSSGCLREPFQLTTLFSHPEGAAYKGNLHGVFDYSLGVKVQNLPVPIQSDRQSVQISRELHHHYLWCFMWFSLSCPLSSREKN